MRRIAVAALTALLALGLAPAAGAAGVAATATGPARTAYDSQTYGGCLGVTIVVDFGNLDGDGQRGGVVQCEPTTGRALDVLQAAGVKLEGTASMGLGFARMPKGAQFHNQTLWGSIGWATPSVSQKAWMEMRGIGRSACIAATSGRAVSCSSPTS